MKKLWMTTLTVVGAMFLLSMCYAQGPRPRSIIEYMTQYDDLQFNQHPPVQKPDDTADQWQCVDVPAIKCRTSRYSQPLNIDYSYHQYACNKNNCSPSMITSRACQLGVIEKQLRLLTTPMGSIAAYKPVTPKRCVRSHRCRVSTNKPRCKLVNLPQPAVMSHKRVHKHVSFKPNSINKIVGDLYQNTPLMYQYSALSKERSKAHIKAHRKIAKKKAPRAMSANLMQQEPVLKRKKRKEVVFAKHMRKQVHKQAHKQIRPMMKRHKTKTFVSLPKPIPLTKKHVEKNKIKRPVKHVVKMSKPVVASKILALPSPMPLTKQHRIVRKTKPKPLMARHRISHKLKPKPIKMFFKLEATT